MDKKSTTQIAAEIKRKLEARRQELMRTQADYQIEAKPEPRKDIPDLANEESKFNVASSLVGHEKQQINEIDGALSRLAKGSYGFCESCEEAISPKRLKAMPEARYCITCSLAHEQEKASASTAHRMSQV